MKQKNNVLKAGIWYTISNFLIKGLSFLTMPIFTRLMTKGEIGDFSNITSWVSILAIVTTFELYSSVTLARFDYKNELNSYISSTLFLGTIITGIFYCIVILFKDFFLNIFSMDFITINIVFIYLLVYPAIQMLQVKNRIEYNYKLTVVVSIGSSLISTLISLLGVMFFENHLNARIYGFYIPLIILYLFIYIFLMIKGKSISTKYWKYALTISLPLILHLLAGNVLNSSDRIMINKMIDNNATALYTIAYSCSMVVSLLWSSLNSAWSPWAFEMLEKKNYNKLKQNSKLYFLFFIAIVIVFMVFAPEILSLMGGESYMEAVYVIPPVMVGYVYQFVYSFYVNIETYNKKQNYIAIGTIIAAIINIVLNLIFINLFGYIAAAYTTLIGYMALYLIHYFLVRKLNFDSCYDNKFFIKYLIIITFSIIIVCLLYHNNIIRYILILILFVIILLIFIKNRKIFSDVIHSRSLKPLFNNIKIDRN